MVRIIFVLLVAALAVSSEEIEYKKCEDASEEQCSISVVRVSPCVDRKVCKLRKGHDVHISFDFTPRFNAEKLKTDVYWTTVPWSDLDSDACKATSCPSVAGTQQQFNTTMHLGKKLPNGIFEFKWQVYDAADDSKKCCFKMTVKLRK